jgi:phenylalanyl-tRNA synthetase beta chain
LEALPPFVRLDLPQEEDLIEEVARVHGYDKLDTTLHKGGSVAGRSRSWALTALSRDALVAAGYNEIQTYSFTSPGGVDDAGFPQDAKERRFVRLLNPLGEENSVMRTTLLPGLFEVMGRNHSRNIEKFRAFEAGRVFFDAGAEQLPVERISLSIGGYGGDMDFFAMKGALEVLFGRLGLSVVYEAESGAAAWHPGRCARVLLGGAAVGVFGELHPDTAERCGVGTRCYAGEFDLEELIARADVSRCYSPLPRYPAVGRDIALLAEEALSVKRMEDVIRAAGGKLLESVRLFDVYRGRQVAEGFKSAAFNLIYRSRERTLTEEEVAVEHAKVIDALERELGITLRDV